MDQMEYAPQCVQNALAAAEVGSNRNLAVLAAELRYQYAEVDHMAAEIERLEKRATVLAEEKRQLVVLCEAIGAKARSGEIPRFWESSASD